MVIILEDLLHALTCTVTLTQFIRLSPLDSTSYVIHLHLADEANPSGQDPNPILDDVVLLTEVG